MIVIKNDQKLKILPKQKVQTHNNTKRTQAQYICEVALINPNIEVLGTYINARTAILHKCKLCGKEWNTTPSRILLGYGCKECSSKSFGLRCRLTNEDFLKSIENTKNPTMEIIGEYVTAKIKIQCLCKLCNEYFYSLPSEIKKGRGHQKCSNKKINLRRRLDSKGFKESIYSINPNVLLLEEYTRSNNKIKCKCLLCNYEWSAWPLNLKKGVGCPECAEKQRRLTRHLKEADKYMSYLNNTVRNVELVDEYIDTCTPILHKCLVCNNTWKIDPHHMSCRGACCPHCSGSKGEQRIRYFLDKYQIQYKPQKRYKGLIGLGNGSLSYDFYLPTYNLLIEFQGRQHKYGYNSWGGEEQLEKQKEHDKRKREYAKDHNINLLEIWYYDYNNIEEILTNYLNLETVETVIPA